MYENMSELEELITVSNRPVQPSENQPTQPKLLLEALLNNDLTTVQRILKEYPREENIDGIVESPEVRNSLLLWAEPRWYYWELIHFAAYSVDYDKLKYLLDNYPKNRINALTIFSENALHVLLEYGKRIDSYKIHLTNGWESRECKINAKEKDDLIGCSKLLVDFGVDVNHVNIWGDTPLTIAAKNGYHTILKLLLKQKHAFGDKNEFLTAENLAPPLSSENPSVTLFNFLKTGAEELFLRYFNGNVVKQYANLFDGDNDSNTSGTMLQLCFIKGYLEVLKHRNSKNVTSTKDLINSEEVKTFISKGYVKCIEHLLYNGADIKVKNRIFSYLNLFEVSVKFCYFPFLIILLEHSNKHVSSEDIISVLEKHSNELLESKKPEVVYVLFILFTKLENLSWYGKETDFSLINYKRKSVLENIMQSCLKHNTKNEYTDVILKSLRLGGALTHSNASKINPLANLGIGTLEKHLNECIIDDNDMCFNSLVLDDRQKYSETSVLYSFVQDKNKVELLNHPVLIYLTHCKWLKTNKFFYFDIILYAMFLLSLFVYMIDLEINYFIFEIRYIFYFFLGIHIFKEFAQLCLFTYRYFLDVVNYLEAFVLVFSVLSCVTKNEICIVLSILSSSVAFMYMLGQIPRFTKYMIIVSSTKYFFEYVLFYFLQFFSFALCFVVLLPPAEGVNSSNVISEIFKNLFNSLIFFIGQFDGDVADPPNFPIFGRIIVALFAFCMTIILNNLLVGLIVTDMDTIQKTAKLLRQVKTIKYIIRTEKFLQKFKRFFNFNLIHDINIFTKGHGKYLNYTCAMYDKSVFDDDDKQKIVNILEQNDVTDSFCKFYLKNLYQHIILESFSENSAAKGKNYILNKLHQLEGALKRKSKLH